MLRIIVLLLTLSACDGQLAGDESSHACPVCPACALSSASDAETKDVTEAPHEDAEPEACHSGVVLVRVPCGPGRPLTTACFELTDSCD